MDEVTEDSEQGPFIEKCRRVLRLGSVQSSGPTMEGEASLALSLDLITGLLSQEVSESKSKLAWTPNSSNWEPDEHFSKIASQIGRIAEPKRQRVAGITEKDRGFAESLTGKPNQDQAILGVETFRLLLLNDSDYGQGVSLSEVEILLARHVLEHCSDVEVALKVFAKLLSSTGILMLEVPDCEPAFRSSDFSELWDEHLHYFTVGSLGRWLERANYKVLTMKRYKSNGENILCAIASKGRSRPSLSEVPPDEIQLATKFAAGAIRFREKFREFLDKAAFQEIYIFGANHRARTFIDFFLPDTFDVVVLDDDPQKQGRFISNRRVAVQGREALGNISSNSLVLVSMNPIRSRNLIQALGDVHSIDSIIPLPMFFDQVVARLAETDLGTQEF